MHDDLRVSTGIPGLDRILGGGLVKGSGTVVRGPPGVGKTILATQALFHQARNEAGPGLYLTALSEPLLSVQNFMAQFSYFDPQHVEQSNVILRELALDPVSSLKRAVSEFESVVTEFEPSLICIDPITGLLSVRDQAEQRKFLRELSLILQATGSTVLVTEGEGPGIESAATYLAGVGGNLISFHQTVQPFGVRRIMRVERAGPGHIEGATGLVSLNDAGMKIYTSAGEVRSPRVSSQRVKSGVLGLDQMFHGGPFAGSSTAVIGASGTGKSLLGVQFILHGAISGESGLLLSLEESLEQVKVNTSSLGWNLDPSIRDDRFRFMYQEPFGLQPEEMVGRLGETLRQDGVQRLVIDSLSAAALGLGDEKALNGLVAALVALGKELGVTILFLHETPTILGSWKVPGQGYLHQVDNILFFKYIEHRGLVRRAAAILKFSGSNHNRQVRELKITRRGLEIDAPFEGMTLSGEGAKVEAFVEAFGRSKRGKR